MALCAEITDKNTFVLSYGPLYICRDLTQRKFAIEVQSKCYCADCYQMVKKYFQKSIFQIAKCAEISSENEIVLHYTPLYICRHYSKDSDVFLT